ncbi:hypothetical protein D9758_003301 [Tetrapyrgos nigripes]|uniref:RWD domain-containing protein n=1 Tax=Tetrapyrgos nigripes TaxID=182062 RepID=A0A8H5GIJ1_9AGAR|nr:hypothetical protein D9758_003301 [Tetrapyrgos nigripes]
MSSDVLTEEFEVLESIYPTELSKTSERDIQIDVEPENLPEGEETLKLKLHVHYTPEYPDALPDMSLDLLEGEFEEAETIHLLQELTKAGEENLGMAMTFTLVSHLREQLSELVLSRAERGKKAEMEKERLAIEEEEARTRGTPVTVESFKAWKIKFDAEQAAKKAQEEDQLLKGLTPKEREEHKRVGTRFSGRQLFERNRNLEEDTLMEEGTVSVDISQYERTRNDEEEDADVVTFSDIPQNDLFRRCKQEEEDAILPNSSNPYGLKKLGVGPLDSEKSSQQNDTRIHSPHNRKESSREYNETPRRRSSPGNRLRQPDDKVNTDDVEVLERSFLGVPRVGHSPQRPRSEKLVEVFRKITSFSSQIVQDTLTLNQEERKLQTYNDISTTLSRISESAASAVAPPLAEIILTRVQSKERLEEGYHALGAAWDQVFDIFVTEVAQTIEEKLEAALRTIKNEANDLANDLVASDSKSGLKRKFGDPISDSDLGRSYRSDSSRDGKRRKITADGSYSPVDTRENINDLSSLEEILQRMKSKIDQQNNSLQILARENQELKGQLQAHGGGASTSDSSIPRAPKEMLNAPTGHSSNENEGKSYEGSRPRYSRDREGDRRLGNRESRSREGYDAKRRDY